MEANILSACNCVADGMIRLETNIARGVLKRVMRIEKMAFTSTPDVELEYVITSSRGMQIVDARADPEGNHLSGQLST
jgi:KaiC/GvpD/RAD55 family RecA-like ATPase